MGPAEPEERVGQNTTIRFKLGERFQSRRFRSDNTLQAAINHMGSMSSLIPSKLETGDWILVNSTTFPPENVDLDMSLRQTFYALGMWPSAELTISLPDAAN